MKDKTIQNQGDFNLNPSGLPYIDKFNTGANTKDNINVVKLFEFDIETSFSNPDNLYNFKHNLGVAYDFYGQYKKDFQDKWTSIPNITRLTAGGLTGGIDVYSITKNDITFWIDFLFDFPTIDFKIFFITFNV